MLNFLRRAAKTWVFKGLFAILVVSFAIWGMGNVQLGGAGDRVATVGSESISVQDFQRALQRELISLSNRAGRRIGIEEARQMGADRVLLARLTRDAALNAEAKSLGVSATDKAVRDAITESPSFQGVGGTFDPEQYKYVLKQLGQPVDKFEGDQRRALAREQVSLAITGGVKAPSNMARTMLAYRLEKRQFAWAALSLDAVAADPGTPDEAAIKKQYEATPDAYSTPEIRHVSYVAMDPAKLAEGVQVSEEDLKKLYDDRRSEFVIPEKRAIDQLVYPNEQAAKDALAKIESGEETFADAAKALDLSAKDVSLGELAQSDLPKAAGDAAFAGGLGVVGPVETNFGPALLNVRAIIPAKTTTFEDAKDRLRKEAAASKAQDKAVTLADDAANLVAQGDSLSAIADALGLKVETADVRKDGEGQSGLTASKKFIDEAFAADVAEERDLVEGDKGAYFVLRVDKIDAAAVRPLDEVRDKVIADWQRAQREADLSAKADAAVKAINGGAKLADVVSQYNVTPTESDEVTRQQSVEGVPPGLIGDVFDLKPGEAASAKTDDGVVVAQLDKVIPADLTTEDNKKLLDLWSNALDQSVGQDLYAYYGAALTERDGATVNPQAMERVLNSFR